jgi:thiamine-monophosphate kinase
MSDTLADIGEFGLIEKIHELLKKEGAGSSEVKLGIGDDCASFLPRPGYEILITCDCLVEGRHYLPEYITPVDLGRRSMSLNISDVGAMGGHPLYALVSLGLKAETPVSYVKGMYRGFIAELNPFGASIIGGNLTKSEGALFIDITLVGEVEAENRLCRSTAKPGHTILVTGNPGQAAAGLLLLMHPEPGQDLRDNPLVRVYNTPSHRAWEGRAIAKSGLATAMIDTSDGLVGDLGHICRESGVGAVLIQDKLPLSNELRRVAQQMALDPYDLVLNDSDDYELLITCPPEHADQISSIVNSLGRVSVAEIGMLTGATGNITLMLPNGSERQLPPKGWDHFY